MHQANVTKLFDRIGLTKNGVLKKGTTLGTNWELVTYTGTRKDGTVFKVYRTADNDTFVSGSIVKPLPAGHKLDIAHDIDYNGRVSTEIINTQTGEYKIIEDCQLTRFFKGNETLLP